MGHLPGALERSMQEQPATDQPAAMPELPAIDQIFDEEAPVPEPYTGPVARCGTLVRFFLRPNEWRAGRREFPALVMKAGERGAADLLVFLEAQDFWDQRDVPVLRGDTGEYGWMPATQAVGGEADLGEILFGPYAKPEVPIVAQLSDLHGHVAAILERLDQIDARFSTVQAPYTPPPPDQSQGHRARRRERRG